MRGEKEYTPFLQATIVCLWSQLLGANLRQNTLTLIYDPQILIKLQYKA